MRSAKRFGHGNGADRSGAVDSNMKLRAGLDAETARRMLDGEPVGPAPVVSLLAACRVVPSVDEPTASELRVLAAFRAATMTSDDLSGATRSAPRRTSRWRAQPN
jgi:hypothetical protein